MAFTTHFDKPQVGSWTEAIPDLGTGPISYEDSISPEFYELERKAIFERSWLNVGRVEQLSRNGSYFTKDIAVANASLIIVRGLDDGVKQQLAAQVEEHGGSMEAEVRDILTKAARRPHIGMALLAAAQEVGGVEELDVPERSDDARAVDFE